MHPDVYSSIICNSQIMETAQVSLEWWMGKEEVGYIHSGILFSWKKEQNLAFCKDMDGAREYYAKQKKSEKDKYYMISLICGI